MPQPSRKSSLAESLLLGAEQMLTDAKSRRPAGRVTRFVLPADDRITPEEATAVRKELELTQSQFGELIGVSVKTVRAWEQGLNPIQGLAVLAYNEIREEKAKWKKRATQLRNFKVKD